ncbi:MAG: hypothetical protein CMO55_13535 [Verrucomicrobiales bacterium]|nr:hypothetical protein [Verrucomicrobiales bacterium]
MREIEKVMVHSVEEFLQEMVPQLGFLRTPIYRGQAKSDWSIRPTLFREEVAKTEFSTWAELEAAFLIRMKQAARGDLGYEPMTELEWMSIAQHNGLPTRMSTWTTNALVALYYACDTSVGDEDGAVWRILPGEKELVISQDYEQVPEQPKMYVPQKMNPAMLNQRVTYLCHPLPAEDATPETFEDVFELGSDNLHLAKIVIPAAEKNFIRRRLATMGVDSRSLNPGLAGLCQQIREEVYSHTDSYEWIFPQ